MYLALLKPLQKIAEVYGLNIQPTAIPDEFLLIDKGTNEESGMGEGDTWSLSGIFDLLKEMILHPESISMMENALKLTGSMEPNPTIH